jgi:hypothetical protein
MDCFSIMKRNWGEYLNKEEKYSWSRQADSYGGYEGERERKRGINAESL